MEASWISTRSSDNLTSLPELTQRTLLDAIKKRYEEDLIYTDVGDILVAVNPFRLLPIYGNTWSEPFCKPDLSGMVPHIYKTAARAYNAMVHAKKDQVCVISGESGAGKTESAKLIMQQVMAMCKSSGVGQSLQRKITQLNPILEAFGNAKTALNDNSSRFGKFVQLIFEPNGRIVGAGLEQYLLEKSRVCVQGDTERNFHIFYYLYAGLDQAALQSLQLKKPTEHRYLSHYAQVMEECASERNKKMLDVVMESMLDIGFEKEEVQDIQSILAAVILIGDVDFKGEDGGDDNSVIRNPESVERVSTLLGLESASDLSFALTTLRTETRGEAVDKRYKCSKAADVRDALAKALYSRLFQWIVTRLNSYLQPYPSPDHLNIGILDIFGFENFEKNSFEQFCINLANEQLQCYFNHQIFAMEKVELLKEGLEDLGDITYTDNEPLLELFMTKPIGIISLLDEQCRGLNGTEKAFVQRCKDSFKKHPNFTPEKGNQLQFTVHHYAGKVLYRIEGFLDKNKDPLPEMLVESVKYGKIRLLGTLFRRPANPSSELRKSIMRKSQRSIMRAMSRKSFRMKKQKQKPQKMLTVAGHFQQSLKELMERMFAASPHFIRCIKPNHKKQPKICNDEFMLKQLTYTGMLEAVRVRREGFSYRPYFSDFFTCYGCLAYHFTDSQVKGSESACKEILEKVGLEGWKLGKSRVFLRYFHEEKLQLLLKDLEDKAVFIQKIFRGWSTRKRTGPLREKYRKEKTMLQAFLSLANTRGKDCVEKLIELNMTDILLAKKRFTNMAQKTTHAPLSSRDSFKVLSEAEQRVRRAKQFGVQLLPGPEQQANTSSSTQRLSSSGDEMERESNPTPAPTNSPKEHDSTVHLLAPTSPAPQTPSKPHPVPRPRQPRISRTGQQHVEPGTPSPGIKKSPSPVPRPRSNRISSGSPPMNKSSLSGEPDTNRGDILNLKPVPKPRKPRVKRRVAKPEETDTVPSSAQQQGNGSAELGGKVLDHKVKRLGREVGGQSTTSAITSTDKRSSNHLDSSAERKTKRFSMEVRASADYQAKRTSKELGDTTSPPRGQMGNRSASMSSLPTSSKPPRPGGVRTSQVMDVCVETQHLDGFHKHEEEDVVDSTFEELNKVTNRYVTHHTTGNQIMKSGDVDASNSSSMVDNFAKLRMRANSTEREDVELGGRTWSMGSSSETGLEERTWSISSAGIVSPSHNAAPMADKRGKRRKWSVSRGNSSNEGSPSHKATEVIAVQPGEEESDLDVMGFYPSFNENNATDYVLGQPQGTYLVYREEDISMTPSFVLMVSMGKLGVRTFPIISIGNNFYLNNIDKNNTIIAHHLKGLLEHYRSHDLSFRLRLGEPRLLPGVLVSQTRNGLFQNNRLPKQAVKRKH